ncbi:amidoligase family protein [Nocardia sputi]|uniref:amidoligase family protein n=1 Tax=Nocardia sputi TaxID=2943705 RepID=UPI0020BDF37A|nr:amidoligase family protein [Nocardia sputi]
MPASTLADSSCEECSGQVHSDDLITTIDGDRVCPGCADGLSRCDCCAARARADTLACTTEDTLLCRECLTGWHQCGECDVYTRVIRGVVGTNREVCAECAAGYETCGDCGDLAADTRRVDGGDRVCARCEDEDYRECSDCYVLVRRGNSYCDSCTDSYSAHSAVHDSYYTPELRFHGDGPLFLGMELEIKTPSRSYRGAVDTAVAHIRDLAYLKEDGSISCGFELVTHPMSYEYALAQFPWQLLNRLRLLGCYTDDGVGIHVHVSRAGFSSPAHAYRWLKFVYRNEDSVTTLARRSSTWAQFSPQQRSSALEYAKGGQAGYGRYQAINVCPEDTFELRVFASSLHPQQVQAALAFAAASVEYTRGLSAADIARRRGWEWTAFTTWVRSRPDYSPLLAEMEALACAS